MINTFALLNKIAQYAITNKFNYLQMSQPDFVDLLRY